MVHFWFCHELNGRFLKGRNTEESATWDLILINAKFPKKGTVNKALLS